ncbi:MAG: hypothetical protein WCP35_16515 [Verrucomicrobiota bacterium]
MADLSHIRYGAKDFIKASWSWSENCHMVVALASSTTPSGIAGRGKCCRDGRA